GRGRDQLCRSEISGLCLPGTQDSETNSDLLQIPSCPVKDRDLQAISINCRWTFQFGKFSRRQVLSHVRIREQSGCLSAKGKAASDVGRRHLKILSHSIERKQHSAIESLALDLVHHLSKIVIVDHGVGWRRFGRFALLAQGAGQVSERRTEIVGLRNQANWERQFQRDHGDNEKESKLHE